MDLELGFGDATHRINASSYVGDSRKAALEENLEATSGPQTEFEN